MIALDTNVLVRFLVQDDEEQASAASHVIEAAIAENESVFICLPVLCELLWLLERVYRFPQKQIATVAAALIEDTAFLIERGSELAAALKRYHSSEPGLVDLLIGEISRAEGCRATFTFDQKLLRLSGFRTP